MRRNDIYWADLGSQGGRRPVCVLTRDAAVEILDRVTCAPITRSIRGIPTEVEVGPLQGLPEKAVISCDNLITIGKTRLDPDPLGHLDPATRVELDRALRYSLDIVF
ncbi:MAG: type II toxin-antitoxin system PemK/MazF family toxin [Acidimicrobiia bacterium]